MHHRGQNGAMIAQTCIKSTARTLKMPSVRITLELHQRVLYIVNGVGIQATGSRTVDSRNPQRARVSRKRGIRTNTSYMPSCGCSLLKTKHKAKHK